MRLYIKLLIICLLWTNIGCATTYHVATDGSGDYTTIAQVNAAMGSFTAGDKILFNKSNIWTFDGINNVTLAITCKGDASNYITFGSYGSGVDPIFDADETTSYGISLDSDNGNYYIKIEGIEIKNSTSSGIKIGVGDMVIPYYVTVDDCVVHDCSGINFRASNVIITNTEVYNAHIDGISGSGNNIEIGYCNIHDVDTTSTTGDCIQFDDDSPNNNYYVHHNTLNQNTFNKGCFISTSDGTGSGCIFEYNTCIGGLWGFMSSWDEGTICRYNNFTGQQNHAIKAHSNNGKYYNNIAGPMSTFIYCDTTRNISIEVYNNTAYGMTYRAFDLNFASNSCDITQKNNIIYLNGGRVMVINTISDMVSDNNCYYPEGTPYISYHGVAYTTLASFQTAIGQDLNSITSNPLFNSDYTLTFSSPCKDSGINISTVADDYSGNPRPMGVKTDIGAYEYFNTRI